MVTVLVMERDANFRKGITRQLMALPGFKVLEAAEEGEIEELLNHIHLNIAIVGISAGNRNEDLKVVEKIKSLRPWLPVIVMVPERMTSLSIQAMRAGACDDIFVPFEIRELVTKIQKVLGKKSERQKWTGKPE